MMIDPNSIARQKEWAQGEGEVEPEDQRKGGHVMLRMLSYYHVTPTSGV